MGTQALQLNLERTADEVVIPGTFQLLLDVTEPLYGVHKATRELLWEIHHKYVGWPQTLADLHRRAAGDFYHYNQHPEGGKALSLLNDLYLKIVEEADPTPVREDALRLWLHFLDKVAHDSGEQLLRNLDPVREAMRRLHGILDEAPARATTCSPWLKRLAESLHSRLGSAGGEGTGRAVEEQADEEIAAGETVAEALDLYAAALRHVYDGWLGAPDPAEWYAEIRPGTLKEDLPEGVSSISHRHLRTLRETLATLTGGARHHNGETLLALPDHNQISRAYLSAADLFLVEEGDDWEALVGRLAWLFKILSHPGLARVHERALQAIGRASGKVMRAGDPVRRERFVREVFGQLRSQDFSHTRSVLDLTSRVGQAALRTGDPQLTGVLAEELLDIDFHYPDFAGFTADWGVLVDPGHLESIRAYLSIIEVDPALSRAILAALVVQLKIGGVFVADTDLFQRDVSRLLAGSIEPVYHQIKHLLKLLPVYFQDIGAEGDLRDVSTRLDEICGRRDPLCHFLRKQSHVECNPRLVELVLETARFWRTGDPGGLRDYVPQSLYDCLDIDDENYRGLHRLFIKLADSDRAIDELFGLDPKELRKRLDRTGHDIPADVEKAELLFGVHREISRKYSLDHRDIADRLRAFGRLDGAMVRGLEQSVASGDHEAALDHVLRILEDLRRIILDEGETRATEDIYHKRHIAVGIPSMYGSYREPRFEAMGLTFRLESLGTSLFDRLIEDPVAPLSIMGLRQAMSWLRSLIRALRIDGYDVQGLVSCVSMLEQAIDAPEVGGDQYRDVLQMLCRQIEALTQNRLIDVYLEPVEALVARMMEKGPLSRGVEDDQGEDGEERRGQVLKFSERFLRTLIAESFGLQRLDNLASRLLRQLREQAGVSESPASTGGSTTAFDGETDGAPGPSDGWLQPIEASRGFRDGIIHLGNKGFLLKRMTRFGLPVPGGFILTTDLFRARARLGPEDLRAEIEERMRAGVLRLERLTGYRFGDPSKPLLLSVRGGGPISMPGMLDSFLNVGISPEIAAAVARTRGHAWAAWDAYRRFTQLWGMSHGIQRDLFDDLIRDAKQTHSVPKKAMLTADQMRELALTYRQLLLDEGVEVVDDPSEQLLGCICLALGSWDSDNARLYRREVQISDAWGTAVIVQNMVFGNLSERSGTGVLMARTVPGRSEELKLYGDFVVKGQGDDVVSGLVDTFPITEAQRRSHPVSADHSLERDFPAIHGRLSAIARSLVLERGFADQEIEFTFESDRPDDLFILQTRDAILSRTTTLAAFEPSETLEASRAAIGVGVSGGALSGRVAHDASDIESLKRRFPGDPLILLRPDTVPDDIALVLQTDGVLTAIGGATSHAAVVARRLGKTSVVGCRSLEVVERAGYSTVGGRRLEAGDLISINGMDGSVYFGEHPVTMIRVRGLTH